MRFPATRIEIQQPPFVKISPPPPPSLPARCGGLWVGGGGAQIWSRGNFAESCNTPARVEEGGREREIQKRRPNFASRSLDFNYSCKVFTRLVVKVKEILMKSIFKVTGMKGDSAERGDRGWKEHGR